jgi:uncharacterized protein YbaP (TraB family)
MPPDQNKPIAGFETAEEFFTYFESLPPEMKIELTKELLKRPELMVNVVKELRKMADDETIEADVRANAQRLLNEYAFDDETLRAADEEGGGE